MNATQLDRSRSRYRPESLMATGGMGEVWRATDTVLSREVALKILRPEFAGDPVFRERFAAEARHAASLQHPGIAAVFDFGELPPDADGSGARPYLVMELVDGKPLSQLLRDRPRMDPEVARDLVGQAAEALAAAHASGLVHRDVKPANLLVTPAGQVKVTDFGIARAADAVALTRTGQLLGTPQYLSPEQAAGGAATAASDVYALGVVLFECLTGRRPFRGDTPVGTALAHLHQPVPELPDDVPAGLAAITRRALAKDPAERYPDAGSLAAALRSSPVTRTGPDGRGDETLVLPTVPPGGSRFSRGVPSWWPVAVMGVLAVVLLVALALANGGDQPARHAAVRTPTPTPSIRPAKVRVRAAAYVGRPVAEVRDALRALGLQSRVVAHRDNPGGHTAATVAALSPTGLVAKDGVVRLTAWGAPPPPPAPAPAPEHHDKPKPEPHGKPPHHGPKKPHGNDKGKGH
ncbi:MAG TPA: serine/threonine-protein kinase [Marmoricola sp.]